MGRPPARNPPMTHAPETISNGHRRRLIRLPAGYIHSSICSAAQGRYGEWTTKESACCAGAPKAVSEHLNSVCKSYLIRAVRPASPHGNYPSGEHTSQGLRLR
ncbi:hypothetical protein WJX84_007844 [Apatococcus fuscideae]|uniref:Uncharacterized protein n=1 Tax=Apatococcus fuscideae TaxID=2026836 RepID=A0AAW1T3Y5_9CHLO